VTDLRLPATTIADLSLPTTGTQGSTIRWATSNASVISATGKVNRPQAGEDDATVTSRPPSPAAP